MTPRLRNRTNLVRPWRLTCYTRDSDVFDYGIAILKEQTDETMLQTVKAPFLGESSRARVFTFMIGHTWDLYGQLAVYLRLKGHVPPASQRP